MLCWHVWVAKPMTTATRSRQWQAHPGLRAACIAQSRLEASDSELAREQAEDRRETTLLQRHARAIGGMATPTAKGFVIRLPDSVLHFACAEIALRHLVSMDPLAFESTNGVKPKTAKSAPKSAPTLTTIPCTDSYSLNSWLRSIHAG